MRIVGGRLRGRPLVGPATNSIRPTSDRLRESIFNIIEHAMGGIAGARVIDLFAGTGALGFEALSRGAETALFVDDGSEARSILRANMEALGVAGVARVFRRDARKLGAVPTDVAYSLAFLDPPYGCDLAPDALQALHDGRWLASDALVVVEEAATAAVDWPKAFRLLQRREFGDTAVDFARYDP